MKNIFQTHKFHTFTSKPSVMKHFAITITVMMLLSGCQAPRKQSSFTDSIDSLLNAFVDSTKFSGNILIARKGEIAYKKKFWFCQFRHPRTAQRFHFI